MAVGTAIDPRDELTIGLPTYGPTGPAQWLKVDWSQHLRRAMVGGRGVNYLDYGDATKPTVMLVHGLGGRWQNWLANVIGLSEHFHVVALDLPGFGESEMPAEAISIPGYADCIAGLLDHLEVASAFVIGNSMGGMTSIQLALDHPSRVDRLVLVSPAGWSTNSVPPIVGQFAGIAGAVFGRVNANRDLIVRRPKLRAPALRGIVAHPDRLSSEIVYELLGGSSSPGFAPALRAILAHDFRDRLGEIKQPVLFVWGRRDGVITSGDVLHFGEQMPHAERILLRDTGHLAMVEHPEWFDRTASQFLTA
ncbi:MAG: alpha/beta fold hydrolase [Thermoleophilaceae bacterium]|nr:alpha/beta fold hydrolase [Thermoleophilaceae bacterium]